MVEMNFPSMLRSAGLKVTGTRMALLKLIAGDGRHMTADEITAGLHDAGIPVDRVTVYRNIDRMIREGLVIATHLPGRALRVGLCTQPEAPHHHHIVCQNCGRVAESDGCVVSTQWSTLKSQIYQSTGFELTDHSMQYIGICPKCQQAGQRPKESPQAP